MIYVGVDPGKSGAIAVISEDRHILGEMRLTETERDIWDWLFDWDDTFAVGAIEQVGAMPGQGVSSTFKFGQSYGFLRGLLIASGIPFETVRPAKWQTALGCRSGGDKNVTKAKAQELFPGHKMVHANADAFLIAEWVRRNDAR